MASTDLKDFFYIPTHHPLPIVRQAIPTARIPK